MIDFKVGDKVLYLGSDGHFVYGKIYTVLESAFNNQSCVDLKRSSSTLAFKSELKRVYVDTKLARKMLVNVKVAKKGWIYVEEV